MTGLAQRLDAEWDHLTARWRNQAPETSAEQAAAAVTIRPATPGGPVSGFTDTLHNIARRLEAFDEAALGKLEAIQGNAATAEAFDVIAGLTHVNPSPEFAAIITLLKAFRPAPVAGEPVAAGPQVAGQA